MLEARVGRGKNRAAVAESDPWSDRGGHRADQNWAVGLVHGLQPCFFSAASAAKGPDRLPSAKAVFGAEGVCVRTFGKRIDGERERLHGLAQIERSAFIDDLVAVIGGSSISSSGVVLPPFRYETQGGGARLCSPGTPLRDAACLDHIADQAAGCSDALAIAQQVDSCLNGGNRWKCRSARRARRGRHRHRAQA